MARFGGDEFTIILDRVTAPDVAGDVAEKISSVLSQPLVCMGREMYVTTSIGISLYPVDGKDISTLVKRADTAMFRAKECRDSFRFYEQSMEVAVTRRLHLEGDLRRALDRDEFVLLYQPQTDLTSGKVVGTEALMRWKHPEQGLMNPPDFIALAEETGLIGPVGDWVLRTACLQVSSWLKRGCAPLTVAVNLSGRQLEQRDFARTVQKVLDETGLAPNFLELEITETTLMTRAEDVVPMLRRLKDLGIKLAVDDFGTGYSSLSYLKRFPIDTLKVDRSFVRDIAVDSDDAAIVTAIVALAQSLRLNVVAEGVENEEQETFLREHGCDISQGYYVSRPLAPRDFENQILGFDQDVRPPTAKVYPLRMYGRR